MSAPVTPTPWKTALVTGASSGIGQAIAVALGGLGMSVALVGRREERLQSVAKAVEAAGGKALVVAGNITLAGEPEKMVTQVHQAFGRVDVLVNNAGSGRHEGTLDTSDAAFEEQFRLNVWAPFAFVRAVAPLMTEQGGGQIVNVGSVVGYVGTSGSVVYGATKWALRGLNESWREELFRKKIKVAYVAPGYVVTEFGNRDPSLNEQLKVWAMMPEDIAHHVKSVVTQSPNSDVREVVIQVLDRS